MVVDQLMILVMLQPNHSVFLVNRIICMLIAGQYFNVKVLFGNSTYHSRYHVYIVCNEKIVAFKLFDTDMQT